MRYAAIVALLAIAACSSPTPTPAKTSTATTATHSVADIAYLAAVRPTVQGSTDADLIQLGKHACTLMDADTMLNVADGLVKQGFTTAAAAAIATAAIPAYCPQHKDQLTP